MKHTRLLCGAALAIAMAPSGFADDKDWLPPDPPADAAAGECFARYRIAPEFDTYAETVTTQDAYEQYHVMPARLREEVRDYVSREAGMRYIVHEPVYDTITETVEIRPAYTEYVVQPAVHETVTETIMVREPQRVWQRGYTPGAHQTRYDSETGEVWCLVEQAGEYRTVTRNVILHPAEINEVNYPAEFNTITREVLVQRARVEEVPIDPLYDTYHVQVVDQYASVDRQTIPTETETITRYTQRSEERWEWRLVECDDLDMSGPMAPANMSSPPMASYSDHSEQGNTYLYGDDAPTGHSDSQEIPVAQASYPGSIAGRSY
jgi:hypothetical protein